jgi:Tfp pilus assembly protein PilN
MSFVTERGERLTSINDGMGGHARVASVNLLPPEILAGRAFRRSQRGMAAAVVVVAAALGGVYVVQARETESAAAELVAARDLGSSLRAEQAPYADVPRVHQAIDEAQAARQGAMAQDVEWYRYLADFSRVTPAGVWFTSLDMTLANAPGAAAAASGAPVTGVAAINVAGTGRNHLDVAAWLDTLAKEAAVANPFATSSATAKIGTKDVVNFTSTAAVGADALSHRFDRKAGS